MELYKEILYNRVYIKDEGMFTMHKNELYAKEYERVLAHLQFTLSMLDDLITYYEEMDVQELHFCVASLKTLKLSQQMIAGQMVWLKEAMFE